MMCTFGKAPRSVGELLGAQIGASEELLYIRLELLGDLRGASEELLGAAAEVPRNSSRVTPRSFWLGMHGAVTLTNQHQHNKKHRVCNQAELAQNFQNSRIHPRSRVSPATRSRIHPRYRVNPAFLKKCIPIFGCGFASISHK